MTSNVQFNHYCECCTDEIVSIGQDADKKPIMDVCYIYSPQKNRKIIHVECFENQIGETLSQLKELDARLEEKLFQEDAKYFECQKCSSVLKKIEEMGMIRIDTYDREKNSVNHDRFVFCLKCIDYYFG